MFKYVLKNIDLLQESKEEILTLWMHYDIVQNRLTRNSINIDFFKSKFASKVFDFAISVIKHENKTGNCPVIGVMLMLFKKKNIPLSDVFIICVHLKNALLHFAYKNSILNHDTIKELSMLMDYNFEGVIIEYVSLYYQDNHPQNNNMEIKKFKENTIKQESLTSAEIYLQEVHIDMEIIEELNELESDTLNALDSCENLDQNSLDESSNLFKKYATVLNTIYEFEELAYTLTLLSDMLRQVGFDTLDEETKYMVEIYLKAIVSDLRAWRVSIFTTKEAEDIHYLDKTLLSSIAQIQMTLMPQNSDKEKEEVEFF